MSTLEEALAKRHRLSVYHVYHEPSYNICITPFLRMQKELGYNKKKDKKKAEEYSRVHAGSNELNSYFVHQPMISFKGPPRTLRRGSKKQGEPICIINGSMFWRKWTIQFGANLRDIIDPRGVVKWEHRSHPMNSTAHDDCALKGYKVRSWRLFGETGKEYHHQVNWRRKREREQAAKQCTEEKVNEKGYDAAKQYPPFDSNKPSPSISGATLQPAVAEEAVRLIWISPLSTNTRRYHFEYAGITFFWEGTRDLPVQHVWSKRLMPFNHLKLVAKLPGQETGEVFLGLYVSSMASQKFGELSIFDSAISNVLEQSGNPSLEMPRYVPDHELQSHTEQDEIRTTRLYDLIMATAMCMIIGEAEKRLVIKLILSLIADAADNSGGGGGA